MWEIFFKFLWPSQNIWTLPTRPSRAKAMKKSRLWRLKLELPQWILVHSWEGHKIWKKLFLKLLSGFFFSNSCGLRISELYPPVLHGQRQRKNQGFEAWSFNYLNGFWFTAERVTKLLFKCDFFQIFVAFSDIWSLPARSPRAKAMQKSRLRRLKFQLPQWILVHS